MKINTVLILFIASLLFFSCKKEEPVLPTFPPAKEEKMVWELEYEFNNNGGSSYDQIGEKKAWIALETATTAKILHTSDGGANWQIIDVGVPTISIEAVDFVNDKVGYISMHQKGTYRTEDGGNSWKKISQHQGGLFADGSEVTIFTSGGRSYNWSVASDTAIIGNDSLGSIAFPSTKQYIGNEIIYTFSTGVIKSEDKGSTWGRVTVPFAHIVSLVAKDASNWFIVPGPGEGMYGSNDAGASWVGLYNDISNANLPVFKDDTLFIARPEGICWTLDQKTFTSEIDKFIQAHLIRIGDELYGFSRDGIYHRKKILE